MKISIIIPVYNVENYLAECLNSVVNQTYRDIEIIIVNDGSTDNSFSIIQQYQLHDERIKIINQENQGLSAARNAGMKVASGDYLWFIDSDDYVAINACEEFVKHLCTGCDLVVFNRCLFDDQEKEIVTFNDVNKIYNSGRAYLLNAVKYRDFAAPVCFKIFRRNLIQTLQLRFTKDIVYEDLLFSFEYLYNSNKVIVLDDNLYFYRHHRNGNITSTIKDKDRDVLYTVGAIDRYLLQRGDRNDLYDIMLFTWVYNSIIIKYICIAPFSCKAHRIIRDILEDSVFHKYVSNILTINNMPFRYKCSAWLSLNCYPLFVLFIYSYFKLTRIFK
ncbi:Glycosyltransferase involved in cell wall bisynthesis [Bacteroides clarus YIT 12056]|uniref:Glycosyltransferase, group 2 family protein n=1 Tax=Bacteroides clarus YIT 12056 TaxID=762984 RepID=A0ABP2KRI1_9BACE|nr:glycosyltransferase [Bacteroides clarus]EGF52297.1 glycosyltransferase, group 2 family protein [Bacteroides clarus YIT 12056]SHG49797.1 Glycosyltransferase involved in cell wall bisynthesis [Bacteroides clarus YIT 12056]